MKLPFMQSIKKRKAKGKLKAEQSKEAVEEVDLKLQMMKEHLTVHLIDVERICPSPLRKEPEDPSALQGLCDSIRRNGLLQPLTVRRVCKDCTSIGGIFTLICGARRLEALKILGISKAPCVICDIPASSVLAVSASSKIHQKTVDSFELSDFLLQVRDDQCISTENAAARLSLKKESLKSLELLSLLREDEKQLARSAGISESMLFSIVALPEETQRRNALMKVASTLCAAVRQPLSKGGRRRMIFNDLTPLCNSIENLVSGIRKAGVAAEWSKEDLGDYYELRVKVPKKSFKVVGDSAATQSKEKTKPEMRDDYSENENADKNFSSACST